MANKIIKFAVSLERENLERFFFIHFKAILIFFRFFFKNLSLLFFLLYSIELLNRTENKQQKLIKNILKK